MNTLWLAVFLPAFSLEVFSRGAAVARPMAVAGGRGGSRNIWTRNAMAEDCGIRIGMGIAAAHALAPDLRVLQRNGEMERRALGNLAAWAGRFTSQVSMVAGQGLLLEIGGSRRLFGAVENICGRVRKGLVGLGYAGRLAVAPTAAGAWFLAREGREALVTDISDLYAGLAVLPLSTLELSRSKQEEMEGMGLYCLGDLLKLDRGGFARRFGKEILLSLDRALGKAPDPRAPYVPPATFTGRIALPAEVADMEALLFPLHRLLRELGGYLHAVSGGVQRIQVTFPHSHHPATRITVELMVPTRDTAHLLTLSRERLDRTELPATVTQVELASGEILPLAPRTEGLFSGGDQAGEGWEQLLERLGVRLGAGAIRGICPVEDHRPERAWGSAKAGGGAGGRVRVSRPLWLLEEPKALKSVGGRPCFHGVLELTQGPERIEHGWWDDQDVARDYYVVEGPSGAWLWVFGDRRRPGRWFLHGIYA